MTVNGNNKLELFELFKSRKIDKNQKMHSWHSYNGTDGVTIPMDTCGTILLDTHTIYCANVGVKSPVPEVVQTENAP